MRRLTHKTPALGLGLILLWLWLASGLVRADAYLAPVALSTAPLFLPLVLKGYGVIAPPPPEAGWLAYLNYHRTLARLPAVTENTAWSYGDVRHAEYMVKNDYVGHDEDATKPYYTPEGDQAAANSNVMVSGSTSTTDIQAIDLWMKGPFHAVGILDPQLTQVGFGSFREAGTGPGPIDWQMGAALDVIRGLTNTVPALVTFPIAWPGDGMTVNLRSYDGFESPDPLAHSGCSGYSLPTGLPILLQVGDGSVTPSVTYTIISGPGGNPLEHCWFTETNYTNPNASLQSIGRSVLAARDAIVLIPRYPLTAGATYTVAMTVNGPTYTWSFSVSLSATALDLGPEVLTR